jgi:hypothetical protein
MTPPAPHTSFLYEAIVDIAERQPLGRGPLGERFIVPILGGTFSGPGLSGTVLPGGADRQLVRPDGVRELDALYELRCDDGTVLTVHNQVTIDDGAPGGRYAISHLRITAPEGPHAWLSRRVLVGTLMPLRPAREAVQIRVYQVG